MERRFTIKIGEEYAKKDIKCILKNHLRCSEGIIKRLKKGDFILLNSKKAGVREKLCSGDELSIIIPEEKNESILPNPEIPVNVLYEDEDILAVNKPACVATHPSMGHYCDTLANGVVSYIGNENFIFRAVNRLDRQTSGVVLIAKNVWSAYILGEQLKNGKIKKAYYALCEKIPNKSMGEIAAPIAREQESIIKRCVSEKGKYAKTLYKVCDIKNGMALVFAEPITGRTHQIRVHLAHIGCPIFGDDMYGSVHEGERVRLHCEAVTFYHPVSGEKTHISCPIPTDFFVTSMTS